MYCRLYIYFLTNEILNYFIFCANRKHLFMQSYNCVITNVEDNVILWIASRSSQADNVLINCITVMKFLIQYTQEEKKAYFDLWLQRFISKIGSIALGSWVGSTSHKVELEGEMSRLVLYPPLKASLCLMQGFPLMLYLLKGPQHLLLPP